MTLTDAADLAWLTLKTWNGTGALSFASTVQGDVGLFAEPAPEAIGVGNTAGEALSDAHAKYHKTPGMERCDCLELEQDGDALP